MFYIKALAGVGKTALLNAILFSVAQKYQKDNCLDKVVLVLVPSRELRHDLCQDIIAANAFPPEAVLWLGRPPEGRDGLWDELLEDRLKELQQETWKQLDELKNSLRTILVDLDSFEQQRLGQRWSYAREVYLAGAAPSAAQIDYSPFLHSVSMAKQVLREHILLEVTELVNKRDALFRELGGASEVGPCNS
jgi:hypothetical protein